MQKYFDYKDTDTLKKYLNSFGRITPRRYTGLSAKKQRELAKAVKVARFLGFLPYIIRQ